MDPEREARQAILWTGVLAVVVTAAIIALTAANASWRQHLIGQTERHHAVVLSVDEAGRCNRRPESTYVVEWHEHGRVRTGQIVRCGHPYDVGEQVDVWPTDDGLDFTGSRLASWALLGFVLSLFPLLWLIVLVVMRRRLRRYVAAREARPG